MGKEKVSLLERCPHFRGVFSEYNAVTPHTGVIVASGEEVKGAESVVPEVHQGDGDHDDDGIEIVDSSDSEDEEEEEEDEEMSGASIEVREYMHGDQQSVK